MLDIGFIHALRRIAPMLGKDRQTMMFSATMPKAMAELSRHYLDKPIRVEVSPPGKVADKVTHSVHFVPKEKKQDLLIDLAGRAPRRPGAGLLAHQARRRAADEAPRPRRIRGHLDPRQQEPGTTGPGHRRLQGGIGARARRDGCRGARDRHPRCGACLQLRPAERARELRPPDRADRPCRPRTARASRSAPPTKWRNSRPSKRCLAPRVEIAGGRPWEGR
jgi:hypothetical protein